ncbi:MAG: VOC family protein [Rhizobiales bacterium]|nr:VOC family protein [Hyphomicrobiales bacterium]
MTTVTRPVLRSQIGAVFVPVRDIDQARHWYAGLLGVADVPPTRHGHLAVFPMAGDGPDLVLDSRIFERPSVRDAPLFHFIADDIDAAHAHVIGLGAEIVRPVQSGHWFTFRDPDGNVLMACAPAVAG